MRPCTSPRAKCALASLLCCTCRDLTSPLPPRSPRTCPPTHTCRHRHRTPHPALPPRKNNSLPLHVYAHFSIPRFSIPRPLPARARPPAPNSPFITQHIPASRLLARAFSCTTSSTHAFRAFAHVATASHVCAPSSLALPCLLCLFFVHVSLACPQQLRKPDSHQASQFTPTYRFPSYSALSTRKQTGVSLST